MSSVVYRVEKNIEKQKDKKRERKKGRMKSMKQVGDSQCDQHEKVSYSLINGSACIGRTTKLN